MAVLGVAGVVVGSLRFAPPTLGAALGGFLLSISIWRLYGGRPWEALAWLPWTAGAVGTVVVPSTVLATAVVVALLVIGASLPFASPVSLLRDVWTVDETPE